MNSLIKCGIIYGLVDLKSKPQNKMKCTKKASDIFQKLVESVITAKSAIQATEKWMELFAKEAGLETNDFNLRIEEIQEAAQSQKGDDEVGKVVEGVFDGQNMIASDGNTYPVPANYASKSKLIEGDGLKLMIQPNGAFVYKQISPAARKLVTGVLVLDGSQYQVLVDGKTYNLIYAAVTFFRAQVGDEITVVIPNTKKAKWAAIENVIGATAAVGSEG